MHGLLEQPRVVESELLPDDPEIRLRVPPREVDDVDEHPRPLDMAQEGVAEPGPGARALDESRARRPP